MATETELKLSLPPDTVDSLLQHPLLASPPKQQHLFNTYFDTDDLALTRQKVAVRERRIGAQTLLTVKTAGQSQNGLSQRHEWEAPTLPGAFDFRSLIDDADLALALTQVAEALVPVFTTDFERLSWHIGMEDGQVELAIDRGIILVNRHGLEGSSPICEVELELKTGNPAALMHLAQQLQTAAPITPMDDSKATRGYALFHSLCP